MKQLRYIGGTGVIASVIFLLPFVTFAACTASGGDTGCVGNPLKYNSVMEFVQNALRLFVLLALPVLAFFIVLAGFNFILARGNPGKLAAAKWNFLFVIVGTCLVLGAWLLASLIGATITQITG